MKITNAKKTMAIVATVVVIGGVISFAPESYAANVLAVGSTTVFPIAQASAGPFNTDTGNSLTVQGGGSGAGSTAIMADSCDVADRSSPDSSLLAQCVENKIAKDAVCIVINQALYDAGVHDITRTELKTIYEKGAAIATTKWSDIRAGWPAIQCVPRSRAMTSGTRDSFLTISVGGVVITAAGEESTQTQVMSTYALDRLDDNVDVMNVIQNNAVVGQVSYVGIGFINDPSKPAVKAIPLNGIAPSKAVVINGTYPMWRYLYMYTRKPQFDSTYKLAALDYVEYMLAPGGQAVVEQQGFVTSAAVVNPAPYWDINNDGACNVLDAIRMGNKWNQTGGKGWVAEDLNGDGAVNVLDAIALGKAWNRSWYSYRAH